MLNQDPKYNRGIPDLTDMTQEELLEYFKTLDEALLWIREGYAKEVKTRQDVELLCERWEEESPDAYCCLHEFQTDEG